MTKEIVTASGHKVIVDDEDYDHLANFCIHVVKRGEKVVSVLATAHIGRLLMHPPKHLVVDHINGNPLDNRKQNLRIVTFATNMQNRQKMQSSFPHQSKYIGVTRFRSYQPISSRHLNWLCCWKDNGVRCTRRFIREIDAALCYDTKVLEIYGPKAKTNFLCTYDTPT